MGGRGTKRSSVPKTPRTLLVSSWFLCKNAAMRNELYVSPTSACCVDGVLQIISLYLGTFDPLCESGCVLSEEVET